MVLVVDRDIGSCLMLRKMLHSLGFHCDMVHNIDDGLRSAASKEHSHIIVGCLMGDNGCWVFSHAIKLLPRKGPAPVMIGILSGSNPAMKRRCIEEGLNQVLIKPLSAAALSECMNFVMRGQCSEAGMPSEGETCQRRKSSKDSVSPPSSEAAHERSLILAIQAPPADTVKMEAGLPHFGELNSSCK